MLNEFERKDWEEQKNWRGGGEGRGEGREGKTSSTSFKTLYFIANSSLFVSKNYKNLQKH